MKEVLTISTIYDDIKNLTGAHPDNAPESTDYPYSVFELKRISSDDGCNVYLLTVNVWDNYKTYSRIEEIATSLEKKLHKSIVTNDSRCMKFLKGSRHRIPDEDKSIKRIQLQFTLTDYEKEE